MNRKSCELLVLGGGPGGIYGSHPGGPKGS